MPCSVKAGSHVRVLEGRYRGCLGTVTSTAKDEAGEDCFVEYEGGMPGQWVRPSMLEVFYIPTPKRSNG